MRAIRTNRACRAWVIRICAGLGIFAPVVAGRETEVLNERTIWRFHTTHRPAKGRPIQASVRKGGRWVRWGEGLASAPPPADWREAGFDDSGWPRRRAPFFGLYGCTRRAGLALFCARGRFGVTSPARVKGLTLTLTVRGGAVVYVNGREVARGHLPKGEVDPLTPAEDYPREAFVTPDGRKLLPSVGPRPPRKELADRYKARVRRLSATIPNSVLRKGTNVLAVESHRAPLRKDVPRFRGEPNWNRCGLIEARLTAAAGSAVVPNVDAPSGVQVWHASPLLRVGPDADYGDPFEELRPIELIAPQNGVSSGRVVISGPEEMKPLSGAVDDLESAGGAEIPSRAVRVRYARPFGDRGFVALHARPGKPAKSQSIWLTVNVPPDARPGTYTGKLKVRGLDRPVAVPVSLRVCGWRIGDPKDWRTWVNLLQSPESVAGYYRVPLWSDRHFALMARSFELMGRAGNDILGISAVGKSVWGSDPVLVFRRSGGKLVPELKFLRRYLALYDKHAGAPKLLCLHVWNWEMYKRGAGRGGGDKEWRDTKIPVVELRGDKLVPVDMPIYGRPGTEEVWRRAMDGLRDCVEKLGWDRECILLGTSADGWPHASTVRMFKKVAPYARWRAITHGSGAPRWGPTDERRTQPNGMVLGYLELVRRISSGRAHLEKWPVSCNARDCVKTDPFMYRSLPTLTTHAAFYDGFCWKGIDYWTYTTPDGAKTGALNTYVRFGNIVGSTPRTIAAPGPNGAIATVQYEMLREGIQDCEAMWLVRRALTDQRLRGKLGDPRAKRLEAAIEEMLCMLETGSRCAPGGGGDLRAHVRRLYAAAAEVAAATAAP